MPYFIASHPGSDLHAMIDLAVFLKRNGYRPDQVQDFIPAPFDIATCMYYTGIDPFTQKEVYVPQSPRERKQQRALMLYWKPENYFLVREALTLAGRTDLLGSGGDCLISTRPSRDALQERETRRRKERKEVTPKEGDHVHTVPNPARPQKGYRPGRKSARRRSNHQSTLPFVDLVEVQVIKYCNPLTSLLS